MSAWSSATKSANPSSSQVGMLAKEASVATCVASWLSTTWLPLAPSPSKTFGLTKTWTGESAAREPSTVVVTAAIAEYSPLSAPSTRSSCASDDGTSTTSEPRQERSTSRTSVTACAASRAYLAGSPPAVTTRLSPPRATFTGPSSQRPPRSPPPPADTIRTPSPVCANVNRVGTCVWPSSKPPTRQEPVTEADQALSPYRRAARPSTSPGSSSTYRKPRSRSRRAPALA